MSQRAPNRVDWTGLERLMHDLAPEGVVITGAEFAERRARFATLYPAEAAKVRRQAAATSTGVTMGLKPVVINGSRSRGLRAGYFQCRLRDGTSGWLQRRIDDCLQMALSTAAGIPPHLVPDLHIDKQLAEGKTVDEIQHGIATTMGEWIDRRGLTILVHSTPPRTARRWIGIIRAAGPFRDHCIVMRERDCLFDTSSVLPPGKDEPPSKYDPADIDYGITIEKR